MRGRKIGLIALFAATLMGMPGTIHRDPVWGNLPWGVLGDCKNPVVRESANTPQAQTRQKSKTGEGPGNGPLPYDVAIPSEIQHHLIVASRHLTTAAVLLRETQQETARDTMTACIVAGQIAAVLDALLGIIKPLNGGHNVTNR